MPMFDTLAGDLRLAVRTLVKSPAFSLAALAALTLGIGVNTAIFSVVNAVLLRPLPYPDPDRIVYFTTVGPQGQFAGASPAKFAHFRAQSEVTRHAAAFTTTLVNLTEGSFPEQLRSARVSADFFTLFGVTTAAGRTFTADEDRPGGDRVAVLSHGLWATKYAADPSIVGRAIALDGQPYTVVGVLDEMRLDDVLQESPQLFLPFQLDTTAGDHAHYFQTAGRLLPGVSVEQAQARLQTSAADFRARFGAAPSVPTPASASSRWGGAGSQRPLVAARALGRGRLRAAHRLRQRRQPAAGARDRPAARARRARRARRLARPHRPAAADREPDPVARRRARWGWRWARSASARCSRSTPPACRASAPMARWSAWTGASWPSRWSSRSAPACCSACCRRSRAPVTDLTDALKEAAADRAAAAPCRTDRAAPGRDRSRPGADPAGRLDAADSLGDRARPRRPRLQHRQRAHDAHGAHRPALRHGRRPVTSCRRAASNGCARCRA